MLWTNRRKGRGSPLGTIFLRQPMLCRVEKDTTQSKSEIAQHPVDELDINFVKMNPFNHFVAHSSALGNL
jgi:hypothetical protein